MNDNGLVNVNKRMNQQEWWPIYMTRFSIVTGIYLS